MPILGEEIQRRAARDASEFLVVCAEMFGDRRREILRGAVPQRCVGSASDHRCGRARRMELLGLGAAGHGAGGMRSGGDGGLHGVEISGADERLVLGGAVTGPLLAELALLHLRITEHAVLAVGRGQFEHRQIQRVPAGKRDELEAVAHGREILAPALHARPASSLPCQLKEGEQL